MLSTLNTNTTNLMKELSYLFIFSILVLSTGCKSTGSDQKENSIPDQKIMKDYNTIGEVIKLDASLDNLIAPDAKIEILASGFDWSEGPVWVDEINGLLFCDIPPNKIHIWKEGDTEAAVYLTPSGYTSDIERGGEVGSNGLIINQDGKLVLCQHGDRRIASLDAPLNDPSPNYKTIADKYDDKRFNSQNDVIQKSNGDYYFTDPPYGLEKQMDDPSKEIDFQGVYKSDADGNVTLLVQTMTRPNGLAFSPDEKVLYVANSDPEKALWNAYDVQEDGTLDNERIFYNATGESGKGLPDGMKVDKSGNIYATGPGGVFVMNNNGKVLGKINTTEATSNCAFGGKDRDYLYMTCDMHLMRIKLKS